MVRTSGSVSTLSPQINHLSKQPGLPGHLIQFAQLSFAFTHSFLDSVHLRAGQQTFKSILNHFSTQTVLWSGNGFSCPGAKNDRRAAAQRHLDIAPIRQPFALGERSQPSTFGQTHGRTQADTAKKTYQKDQETQMKPTWLIIPILTHSLTHSLSLSLCLYLCLYLYLSLSLSLSLSQPWKWNRLKLFCENLLQTQKNASRRHAP